MVNVIEMKEMGYLNLFSKVTRINTRFCFTYNGVLIFCVPKPLVSKAVGEHGRNAKKLGFLLRKRIKIISQPRSMDDLQMFIQSIVSPMKFRDLDINEEEIIINAGTQNKAALIGRNKTRLNEMQKIVQGFFKKQLKIV